MGIIARYELIRSVVLLTIVTILPKWVVVMLIGTRISNVRYSCVWMEKDEIAREFKHPYPDRACWMVGLEWTAHGEYWRSYQPIYDLKNEPKAKKAVFMSMRRGYASMLARG